MRYFSELAYNGTQYHGWQKQPNATSVQAVVDHAFSTILNSEIEVVGCGRTDTGVHASQYFMHFDHPEPIPDSFVNRVNKFLPDDIAIRSVFKVNPNAHARFDAVKRSYEFHLLFEKSPFDTKTAWHYYLAKDLDVDQLNEAARILLDFQDFFPFCKTNHDAKTMACSLTRSEWLLNEKKNQLVFHISSNRFLRGMVRLVVGMCLNVASGKLTIGEIEDTLKTQTTLRKSWSVPAHGLYLTEVDYGTALLQK